MTFIKRRTHFVDRAVQGALVRRMVYHWLSFLGVSVALSLVVEALSDPFLPVGDHLRAFFRKHIWFVVALVCMTPLYLWDTMKLSNRFVGPIFRLHYAMHDLAHGREVRPLKFRPGDYWCHLADDFNGIVQRQRTESSLDGDQQHFDGPTLAAGET